jgi:hypothetical protein
MEDLVKLDIRLVERMMARGELKREDYEKHLKNLADTAAQADNVEASVVDHGVVAAAAPAPKKGKGSK